MSSILSGGSVTVAGFLQADDERNFEEQYRMDVEVPPPTAYGVAVSTYRTQWWPGTGQVMSGDPDGSTISGPTLNESQNSWEETDQEEGGAGRYGIIGVTRDAYGSPLGGMTVKLYRTSDDSVQSSTVSDQFGNYTVTTPYYPDAHYIIVYKSGSPDTFGTTPNTLIAG